MADVNINAPADQAPTMAPPTRTDDQILPYIRWHTNFFRAFTASSTIPSIYIQQFLDIVRYDKSAGCYKCQLDEQWFDLTKDTLRDALQITPVNNNQAFSSPPSSDALINFSNELGYPNLVQCRCETPRPPVLQILWGIVNRSYLDYAERIWEEFTQSIHTFIKDKKNMAQHTHRKKKATLIVIPSIQFTKLIIYHLQRKHKFHPRPDSPLHFPNEEPILGYLKFSAKGTKREVFGMPIPSNLITTDIQGESYYEEYLAKVAKHQRYLAGETRSDPDSPAPKPTKTAKKSKPTMPKEDPRLPVLKSAPGLVSKRRKPISSLRSVDEFVAEDIPEKEPRGTRVLEISTAPRGQGKGKEKVTEEQAARDLLTLQTPKKKSPAHQYIIQRRTSVPTGSSGHDESSSLYAELGLTDSEAEPNPDVQAESQDGPNPGDAEASQPLPSHFVHVGLDLEHMDLNVVDAPTQPHPEQMDEGFTATAYPKRIDELEHIMENLIQDNKQLEQRLDSHGACLYTLEHLDIPHRVSKVLDEVVVDAVDWAIQAPLRNRFRDLPEADMKEIFHQRMQETNSYKTHEDCVQLYEALEKSMNRDHSEELLKDLAEARKKKKTRYDSPKTPPGSPPHQPPPPLPAGPSGASGSPRASGSSQVPPPPPPPTSTNQEGQSKGSIAPSSSKTAASTEYQAWTTTDKRLRLSVLLTPKDLKMDDDMAPDAQARSSDDEDIRNAHIPKYQMKECHKLLTDSVNDSILRHNISKPLPLGGPHGQVIIQSDFFFNKDLEYLRYGSKGSRPVLSISKMKSAYYPDVGLEQMVPDQMWIEEECKCDIAAIAVRTHMRILSVVRIKVIYMYGDGTLQQIDEALDYRVKEFKVNRINPGLNTRFWTRKDVDRSKEFMFAIQKRLKTRRIFHNLKSFVGGRVRDGDYRLLKRTE
nr:monodehydroascorbate reductase [Tanacetum cinerariifolium]